jgi:lysosomal acid lipase/cholesteryl ester hydrolase
MKHCASGLIDLVAFNLDFIQFTAEMMGIYEFFPADFLVSSFGELICGTVPAICKFGISFFTDSDPSVDSTARLAVFSGHFPSGTSLRCFAHYGQMVNSGNFQRYDFGEYENKKKYGQKTPPMIDMT